MDYVARAKALLEGKTRTAALIIVPLAVAVAAEAGPILPTTNLTCNLNSGACGPGSAVVDPLAIGTNGLTGLKFWVSGGLTIVPTGFFSGEVIMETSGTQNEAFTGDIPLGWTFTLTGPQIASFNLILQIRQSGGGTFTTAPILDFTGSGTFTGSVTLPGVTLLQGLATFANVDLRVFCAASGGCVSGAGLQIPQNSIDFNVPGASTGGVPEPSSAALLGAGLAMAGGWRLLRRRNRSVLVPRDKP